MEMLPSQARYQLCLLRKKGLLSSRRADSRSSSAGMNLSWFCSFSFRSRERCHLHPPEIHNGWAEPTLSPSERSPGVPHGLEGLH